MNLPNLNNEEKSSTSSKANLTYLYKNLQTQDQSVLVMLSLVFTSISIPKLTLLLRGINFKYDNRYFFDRKCAQALETLKKDGLVIEEPRKNSVHFLCNPKFIEEITALGKGREEFPLMIEAVKSDLSRAFESHSYRPSNCTLKRMLGDIRLGIYSDDIKLMNQAIHQTENWFYSETIYQNPMDRIQDGRSLQEWVGGFPVKIKAEYTMNMFRRERMYLDSSTHSLQSLLEALPSIQGDKKNIFLAEVAHTYFLQGKLEEGENILNQGDQNHRGIIGQRGVFFFMQGKFVQAREAFMLAEKKIQAETRGRKNVQLPNIPGYFFMLALLQANSADDLKHAAAYLKYVCKEEYKQQHYRFAYLALQAVLLSKQGKPKEVRTILERGRTKGDCFYTTLFHGSVVYWLDYSFHPNLLSELATLYNKASRNGWDWIAMQFAELRSRLGKKSNVYSTRSAQLQEKLELPYFLNTLLKEKKWEQILTSLQGISQDRKTSSLNSSEEFRLIWLLDLNGKDYSITPKLQKIGKTGKWTKGRAIALARISTHEKMEGLTDQDYQVGAAFEEEYYYSDYGYRYGGSSYEIDWKKAFTALIGHPLLFSLSNPDTQLELVKGELEFWIEESDQGYEIRFSENVPPDQSVLVIKETPTRYKIVEVSEKHQEIAEILHNEEVEIPLEAKERVVHLAENLSTITTVHSNLDGIGEEMETIIGDSKICVHLLPHGQGVRIGFYVKPFPQGENYFKPGIGGKSVITEVEGKRIQAKRDLKEERNLTHKLLTQVPALSTLAIEEENMEWLVEEPEDCLEILLELQEQKEQINLEWPEGEKFKISYHASLSSFSMNIQKAGEWFALSGKLKLDDSRVLDMKQLLQSVQQRSGRFIPVGDGEFISLTDSFRKKLEAINAYSDETQEGSHFHSLASFALQDITDEVGDVKAGKAWKEQLGRLESAAKFQPILPTTLQAELRDYQVEGFQWLSRLAHLGAGACLADDMGLGKTLQALAVILEHAHQGPSLVIAPVSVCINWQEEIARFAPTLQVKWFRGKERTSILEQLQAFDLVICSYGLLQTEVERLQSISWQIIVLDEAQAIKNYATKRSKAAMQLSGKFKLITTGTPIENHLGELWNLMNFINPGLLGSLDKFNNRFANPIQKHQNLTIQGQLKGLLQPFILRRTKTQVLTELPSRTEITLHVEMSEKEMVFYEALRQKAMESLENSKAAPGAKHLQILAELMRLRRACCHSKLVLKQSTLPSAKLTLFGEVVEELLENNHKALVFSQFIDHLDIIRELLDQRGITYNYLDGSTTQKKRQAQIKAFQSGKSDLFLISLKAGGVGLNLTAADYVIHMDPWWNPAVEDQASDRAHRIGQKRPVTIYRLVTKNTIEEKIVALHQKKRDLADNLLSGTELSGKLSAKELIKLIREV